MNDELDKILVKFSKRLAVVQGEYNANEKLSTIQKHAEDAQAETRAAIIAYVEKKLFIDFPTGHAITTMSKVHEAECSSSKGFMCDCSVIAAAQFAVDKAKERIFNQQKGDGQE